MARASVERLLLEYQSVHQNRGPVVAIVGDIADDASAAYDRGVSTIFSINR